jgi:four helix bundle protein
MTQPFGHENLIVYQKARQFVAMRRTWLDRLPSRVAACDHLERAAESIVINIAHGSASRSPNERITFVGHANGSALECAACLDILAAKSLLPRAEALNGKSLLVEIVSMLIGLYNATTRRLRENRAPYRTQAGNFFDHEDLDVYQCALKIITWIDPKRTTFPCSADVRDKLDRSTTSIVLNIAEGHGRFTGKNQALFYETAHKSTLHTAALLDLVDNHEANLNEPRDVLHRIATMLIALKKSVLKI